jgi:hypothetical protein
VQRKILRFTGLCFTGLCFTDLCFTDLRSAAPVGVQWTAQFPLSFHAVSPL